MDINKKNIDQIFKKGTQKEYAFDEKLWEDIKDNLPSDRNPGSTYLTNGLGILGSMLAIVFFSLYYAEAGSIFGKPLASDYPIENVKKLDENKEVPNAPIKTQQAFENELRNKFNRNIHETIIASTTKVSTNTDPNTLQATQNNNEENVREKSEDNDLTISKNNSVYMTKSSSASVPKRSGEKDNEDKSSIPNAISNNQSMEEFALNEQKHHTKHKNVNSIPTTDELKLSMIPSLAWQELGSDNATTLDVKDIAVIPQNKPNIFYLEVQARHSMVLNKVFQVEDPIYQKYKQDNENAQYQKSIGLNISKDLKNFSYGMGIHYENLKERVNIQQQTIRYQFDTSYNVLNDSYMHNGKIIFIIKREIDSIKQIKQSNKFKNYVEIRRLQLPLFAAYKFNCKLWEVEARTALGFNYLLHANGSYLNNDFETTLQVKNDHLKSWVISHQLQLRLAYSLNEKYSIGLASDYTYELTSSMKSYENYFNSYGASIFLKRRFTVK